MSLRTQLNQILPEILPSNPRDAIKGTELIKMLRIKIEGKYSDASLRYHFSIMSCDPASPIAKVEQGQGYYRRALAAPMLSKAQELVSLTQGRLDELGADRDMLNGAVLRMEKFRAIVRKWAEWSSKQPFIFSEAFEEGKPVGNLWKFPEMVMIDWEGLMDSEEAAEILSLKSNLQLPPCKLIAARLRIVSSMDSFREDVYRTLSSAEWANGGELYYAEAIDDEALREAFRRLNANTGVGVTSFGLKPFELDDLPLPEEILNATNRETEALMERLTINRIAAPKLKPHINWAAFDSVRHDSVDIQNLLEILTSKLQPKVNFV